MLEELMEGLGRLKPPYSMIVGTALLAVCTVDAAYVTWKTIEGEATPKLLEEASDE